MMAILAGARVALLVLCAGLAWAFVIRYSRLDWRSTREGAHLMRFTSVIAVILTIWSGFAVFEVHEAVRAAVSIPLFLLVAIELGTRVWLLESAQQELERQEAEDESAAAIRDDLDDSLS